MTQTTARIKKNGMHFEILVDLDEALKFKKGESSSPGLETERIFTDLKKGFKAAENDLEVAFGTTDSTEIAKVIVKQGEIETNQEHRNEEKEKRIKQVVDFLVRNSIDPKSGRPHTPDRIKSTLEQAHVNIKNVPIENQIKEILEQINSLIPIKIETKKYKIRVPAIQTGKAYGVLTQYKEKEDWLNNGDLEMVVSIPAGLVLDFFDKLNGVTHGSAIADEIKE